MKTDRLLKLADVLENFKEERKTLRVPVARFALRNWHCGTAACAVGTAMLHPWFIRRGLKSADIPDGSYPVFGDESGFEAAAAFFKIEYSSSTYLFSMHSYPNDRATAKQVAKRIRAFVTSDGSVPV